MANPNVRQSPRRGDDSCSLRGPHHNGRKLRYHKLGPFSTIRQPFLVKRTPFSVFLSERNIFLLCFIVTGTSFFCVFFFLVKETRFLHFLVKRSVVFAFVEKNERPVCFFSKRNVSFCFFW